jgi:hypothetical protein
MPCGTPASVTVRRTLPSASLASHVRVPRSATLADLARTGRPTVTSALPEVAGDAALLIDPETTAAIAHGLAHLAGDPSSSSGEVAELREDQRARGWRSLRGSGARRRRWRCWWRAEGRRAPTPKRYPASPGAARLQKITEY